MCNINLSSLLSSRFKQKIELFFQIVVKWVVRSLHVGSSLKVDIARERSTSGFNTSTNVSLITVMKYFMTRISLRRHKWEKVLLIAFPSFTGSYLSFFPLLNPQLQIACIRQHNFTSCCSTKKKKKVTWFSGDEEYSTLDVNFPIIFCCNYTVDPLMSERRAILPAAARAQRRW